ncbi:hypothetical protein SAMN05192571_101634 [Pleomorphomonas diazotrophica]|nr:DUF2474 domain-containing protein [Pleomorphomonas diazotrophica]SFM43314.1 hypothetical protein SAMN05192571_101634 [Pleomorphomonas diazotrophica]
MAVRPTLVRLLWFGGYWLAGVVVVSIVAAGIRFWLVP